MNIKGIYANRFPQRDIRTKKGVWRSLCKFYFQGLVGENDVVLDIGAGFCEFINSIRCGRKIAVDVVPHFLQHADGNVETITASCTDLSGIGTATIDIAFVSNLFEHLKAKAELETALEEIHRVLRRHGKLIILQPNFKYTYREYFDYYDHDLILTHMSMSEILSVSGFIIVKSIPRFIPFSINHSLKPLDFLFRGGGNERMICFLIRIYCKLPFLWRMFGKQMLIISEKGGKMP